DEILTTDHCLLPTAYCLLPTDYSFLMRTGILAAGNFIRDYVKIIDHYPEQDMLVSIRSESACNGGGPYNLLVDLAEMGVTYPLEAAGLVGRDDNGEWILRACAAS